MGTNLAQLLASGPATVTYGGSSLLFKDGLNFGAELDLYDIDVANYGTVAQGVDNGNLTLGGTPAGVWGDHAALYRCLRQRPGDFVIPIQPIWLADADTDLLTVPGHVLSTRDTVYVSGYGAYTLPGGTAANTLYYVHLDAGDPEKLSLHTTAVDAATGANKVDLTSTGEGELALVQETPLIIHSSRHIKVTLHNVGIVQPPSIEPGPKKTTFAEVKFEAFRRHGKAWADANSLYTIERAQYVEPTYDPATLQPKIFWAAWGTAAPWSSLSFNAGFKFAAGLQLSGNDFDDLGICNRQIDKIAPTVAFVPYGISEKDILAVLPLQGANTGRGTLTSTAAKRLTISATGAYIDLPAAALTKPDMRYNRKDPRSGELQFSAVQSFTAGVPNVLASISNTAPAA